MPRTAAVWKFDEIDPLKGPKGDTAFLKDNYKTMSINSSFRTPKARFTPRQIHAGATKARFIVRIDDETPWLKVTVTGKIPIKSRQPPKTPKTPDFYLGASKVYPEAEPETDIFS